MNETAKCHVLRLAMGHFNTYLKGDGIDIGAGPDPLEPPNGTVRAWDVQDGDAMLMKGVPDDTYDFVYSSHCLEHLVDVRVALFHWVRILKPGGILYFVVPDWTLYEKRQWPSQFNEDHKHTFSVGADDSQLGIKHRERHWHGLQVGKYLTRLGMDMIDIRLQNNGYDPSRHRMDQTKENALCQIMFIAHRLENFQAVKE